VRPRVKRECHTTRVRRAARWSHSRSFPFSLDLHHIGVMADQGSSIEPYRLPLDDEDLFPSFEGLPNEYTGDISEAAVQGGMWYFVCDISEWRTSV
jgi:hypothetical protein